MARDSSSGASHISLRPQVIQSSEWEKKNTRTIWTSVSSKCKKGSLVTLFYRAFREFCRLSRAYIFAKLLQKPLGMPNHFWPSSSLSPSTDRCRLPLYVSLRQLTLSGFLCQLVFSPPLLVLPVISSSGLCLVSRQNRQRDRLPGVPPT